MNDRDVRKLLLEARKGPHNCVVADLVYGWDYAKLSDVISYCHDKQFVEAIDITNWDSPTRKEFILRGITADGEDFLRDSSAWKRLQQSGWQLWAVVGLTIALLANLVTIAAWNKTPKLYHLLFAKMQHLLH